MSFDGRVAIGLEDERDVAACLPAETIRRPRAGAVARSTAGLHGRMCIERASRASACALGVQSVCKTFANPPKTEDLSQINTVSPITKEPVFTGSLCASGCCHETDGVQYGVQFAGMSSSGAAASAAGGCQPADSRASVVLLKPRQREADADHAMRITRNPYQRAAAVACLLGVIATVAASSVVALPFLTAGVILAFLAYSRRKDYPR
jgi:hypothetical protein